MIQEIFSSLEIMSKSSYIEKKKKVHKILNLFDSAKASGSPIQYLSDVFQGNSEENDFVMRTFIDFQRIARSRNYVDYYDIVSLAVDILKKYPFVQQEYSERYAYILVDEFQDTNP